jgi:hypothetical protein
MLCLIAKGVHLEGYSKRTDIPGVAKRNAYKTFATELNYALNKKNYGADIDRREITKMLDQLLVERKGVAGKGGLVERNRGGRVTRAMRIAWERNKPIGFDGSLSEWNQGRRERVLNLGGLTAKLLGDGTSQDSADQNSSGRSTPELRTEIRWLILGKLLRTTLLLKRTFGVKLERLLLRRTPRTGVSVETWVVLLLLVKLA